VKPVKPKKMIRMEGKYVIFSACNSGTSALVTREGEVYMFGKDTQHCDRSTGRCCVSASAFTSEEEISVSFFKIMTKCCSW